MRTLTLLLVLLSLTSSGQISITKAAEPKPAHVFDSTRNFNYEDIEANIGQVIYFIPWKGGEHLFMEDTTGYFHHFLFRGESKMPIWKHSVVGGKYYKITELIPRGFRYSDNLYYVCVNRDNPADTVYYHIGKGNSYFRYFIDAPFITMSYLENQIREVTGREFISPYSFQKPFFDIHTGEPVILNEKDILKCAEISFLEVENNTWIQPSFLMLTSTGNTIAIPFPGFGQGNSKPDLETFRAVK